MLMKYKSTISLQITLFISLFLLNNVRTTVEELTMDSFVKNKLFCEGTQSLESYMQTQYFRMTKTVSVDRPPSSLMEIMKSGNDLLQSFQMDVNIQIESFIMNFMNVGIYNGSFMIERFDSFNNLVYSALNTLFSSPSRFTDWKGLDLRAANTIAADIFTNLIDHQKPLILEFEKMSGVVSQIKKSLTIVTGEAPKDAPKLFVEMKKETINYLALIFIAAFEHQSDSNFSSKDGILEGYWRNFYEWLEIPRCERLVNGAYNGALDKIKNLQQLEAFLNSNQDSKAIDQIKLNHDANEIKKMATAVPDVGVKLAKFNQWTFFTISNLEEADQFSDNQKVSDKVSFDIFRLEDKKHCLESIKYFENFLHMKAIYKKKQDYLGSLDFYYMIEYLLVLINDPTLRHEFPNEQIKKKAIQIIYLLVNKIWIDDRTDIEKMTTFGQRFAHIIIRILVGLDADEDLTDTITSGDLDEETEFYIIKLLVIFTESNNLPKPNSDELNKRKGKEIVEEDEENLRVHLPNRRFIKVIDRFFLYAKLPDNKRPGWANRYKKKYFLASLLASNLMFKYDPLFFELEKKMAKSFETTYDFSSVKKEYEALQKKYLTEVKGLSDQGSILMTNIAISELGAVYMTRVKERVDELKKAKVVDKQVYKNSMDEILLTHFGNLKSNMIEKEYYKTLIYINAKSQGKIPLPNFQYLLRTQFEDDDRLNMFEFMKRIITYIRHTKKKNTEQIVDTIDINTNHFVDQSSIENGERFTTLLMDVENFFEPELVYLQKVGLKQGANYSYGDIQSTITMIKSSVNKSKTITPELENYRLMMKWNLFDDLREYMHLVKGFLDETKSYDPVSSPLKIRMLTENYTNLYIAMIEHRLFCAEHQFSFEESGIDRIKGFIKFLEWKSSSYENMMTNALPEKEIRFSSLNMREIQNLIYFVNFRLKSVNFNGTHAEVKMSEIYYPYAFREIYLLSSNHPELMTHIDEECEDINTDFMNEKKNRFKDISSSSLLNKHKQKKKFNFCMMIQFNKDMVQLVENQGKENSQLEGHLSTITVEQIFMHLIAPYYDKINPLHMVVQVFNLNMSHASAASEQSASTYTSYITLLDYFFKVIDDMKDGVNDTMNLGNVKGVDSNSNLTEFCNGLNNTAKANQVKEQMIFIRSVLLEKLRPNFYDNGPNLIQIFNTLTAGNNGSKVDTFVSKLTYGYIQGEYNLKPDGDVMDLRLLALLMIYAPHSEFTVNVIFKKNLMGSLPKMISNAVDNESFIYREFAKEKSIEEIYKNCNQWMLKDIKKINKRVDDEALNTVEDDGSMDFEFFESLEDELYEQEENDLFKTNEVIVSQGDVDSNIKQDIKNEEVLVKVIERTSNILVESGEMTLSDQPIIRNHIIKSKSKLSDDEILTENKLKEFESLDKSNTSGIIITEDRTNFLTEEMQRFDVNQIIDSQNQKKTSFEHNSESIMRQIEDEVTGSRVSLNTRMVINFSSPIDHQESQNSALVQQKMEALRKATENAMMKMKASNNTSVKINSVKMVSSQTSSQRIMMSSRTDVQHKIEHFDETSHSRNEKGAHDNVIVYRTGEVGQSIIKSKNDTKSYINSMMGTPNSGLKSVVSKLKGFLTVKSKSWSGNSNTPKLNVKNVPKSQSLTGKKKSKMFRLV